MILGEVGPLVDMGTPTVNGGTKVPISGCVIWAVTVGAVVGAVTPISVETGMAMVADDTSSYVIISNVFQYFLVGNSRKKEEH